MFWLWWYVFYSDEYLLYYDEYFLYYDEKFMHYDKTFCTTMNTFSTMKNKFLLSLVINGMWLTSQLINMQLVYFCYPRLKFRR